MSHTSNNTYYNQFSALKGQITPNGNMFNLANNIPSPMMGTTPLFRQPKNNSSLTFTELVNLTKKISN